MRILENLLRNIRLKQQTIKGIYNKQQRADDKTRRRKIWNKELEVYNSYVYDTEGAKWKQNLVERSHRTDDEEFYCPRGNKINTKSEFMTEAQFWIIYYNTRSHNDVKMNGLSPKEKLEKLGIINAKKIINFPCMILDDFFYQFQTFSNISPSQEKLEKSQNVLTYYRKFQ